MDAGVIGAAASSTLGILALLILVLSGLATAFFRGASTSVKVGVFGAMFAAASLFGFTVVQQAGEAAPAAAGDDEHAVLASGAAPEGVRLTANSADTTDSAQATPPPPPAADGLLIEGSSARPLDPSDLAGLSASELRIARNEIYARHGYIFHSADLRDHFARFDWYRPTAASVALSPLEARNVELIKQAEQASGG